MVNIQETVNNNIHVSVNNQVLLQKYAVLMKETYRIRDLETVRLLSDPLKLQLLQAFADGPKTTKQVAAELGENITKLYRHVDALHDSGLLRVVEERQKRGTVERTFQAVARRFEADHSLFSGEAADDGAEAVRQMLRVSETEILNALAAPAATRPSNTATARPSPWTGRHRRRFTGDLHACSGQGQPREACRAD